MGQFKTKLCDDWVSENRKGLIKPLIYIADDGTRYFLPVGYTSDGFTIPRWLWWFKKPFSFGVECAYLHDFVLECESIDMTFLEANDLLSEALKSVGMGFAKRKLIEWGTDLNGLIVHQNEKPNNWDENQP